ncbi:hypothetical protein ACQPTN_33055 [Bradyrhizobium sp. 13971]|uniref:hypothetical protein n=1 Tax=Bradyrhizobium elkanii TaxID=29448 RepID=UPI000841B7BA|nr:hypothetical protein [Bradyrhizobium elkanii]ODM84360.1 hypothetical protein A6452_16620 [Bradyrhizobium elkanii]ODM86309.1 hypothetical protein A6X20_01330 [Bradyrhizobium elkanii]
MTDTRMLDPASISASEPKKRATKVEGFSISKEQRVELLKVALEYDQLAQHAEQWQHDLNKPSIAEMAEPQFPVP